jgi:S-DNA-T family DNA segregation ATPase FtsK/SpoIIIE
MAKNENFKRGESPIPDKRNSEIIGIILLIVGVVALLSLVSYSPYDKPVAGLMGIAENTKGHQQNLIGPVGALLGAFQITLLGAAGYLIPVALIWFGVAKLLFNARLWPRTMTGFGIVILSAACILEVSNSFFQHWKEHYIIVGPGGLLGRGIGYYILQLLLGKTGSMILLCSLYLIALILITGLPPVQFVRACYILARRKIRAKREAQDQQRAAEEREYLRQLEREAEKERRKKSRQLATGSIADEEDESGRAKPLFHPSPEEDQQFLPLSTTPPPKIIDASARRPEAPKPGDKPFERKPKSDLTLSTTGFENYELPGFDLLDIDETPDAPEADKDELLLIQRNIIDTLKSFGIDVTPGDITRGPTITRYEIYPSSGLRVSRISQLEADLARATRAERINILAPIPGKDTVGIEIANTNKVAVPLRELLQDPEFRSPKKKIPLALGKDVYGKTVIGDLAAMPHLLVAGATGSGKSVCINSIIASILFKFGPDELRFIMVDPKVVEMQIYNKLPHLVVPVVTDPKKTVAALKWVVNEMEKRYRIFAKVGVRNFDGYNSRPRPEKTVMGDLPLPEPEPEPEVDLEAIESIAAALESGELGPEEDEEDIIPDDDKIPDRFPYIVVLIDELADLMQTAPADVEGCIARIAQKARAAGIHLIIATQTPRADVVTGIIKANIPCRIAFQVSSQLDSRVILDTKGADKLVGKGDMLYLPPGSAKLERSQGAFVSDAEVERLVDHCSAFGKPNFETDIHKAIETGNFGDDENGDESDVDEELVIKCIEVVRQEQKASTSLLQRRLRLGYTRAARMMDILEARGLIGPGEGAKPREVFITD